MWETFTVISAMRSENVLNWKRNNQIVKHNDDK